ncbi:hypothetical protein HV346_19175 [Enterobacter sp. RHBSTW-00994]|uniref:hypothetical protein n=1 Tax=Enterobacter sp. RHBSTW-00994 TaxID=2742676 RepID=UPI0015E93035|nr:hypothetical protein [Enterobacter sp. RHBSTW-00994]QLR44657.1 hypothetical protein HV346_19175 [Enterobacter sp. RHBSTW-00994]
MLSDQINFWWNDKGKCFSPIGGKIRQSLSGNPLGYGAREIAGWLSNDIQYALHSVEIWIKNLTNLSSGESTDGNFGMGNAHWVMVTQNKVFIGCEYVEEQQVILTIEQTLYVLEQYKTFLESDYTNPTLHPEPIDVEYIAEGKDAIAFYESLDGAYCLPY